MQNAEHPPLTSFGSRSDRGGAPRPKIQIYESREVDSREAASLAPVPSSDYLKRKIQVKRRGSPSLLET